MLSFIVPGAAIGKGRPIVGRVAGRTNLRTPPKTAAYEGLIAHVAQAAMGGRPLLEGAVAVRIDIRCAVPASWSKRKQQQALAGEVWPTTKPDIDNVEKALFDGLNGVVWRDDVQVVRVEKRKRYGATPGVHVWVDAETQP